jgi:acyl-CoA dehydrogenase
VSGEQVLGRVGEGFKLMQVRLGPARLTHCMRWLGAAARALDIATRYVQERQAFGKKLAEHQAVQWMLADSVIDIHASRLMVLEAAWKLDRGDEARQETSICKVFVAEAVGRVIDRCIQMCGALGISRDLLLERLYRDVRAFRIYDGPSEVHRMVIARQALRARGNSP